MAAQCVPPVPACLRPRIGARAAWVPPLGPPRPAPNALRQGRARGARSRGGKGIPGPDPPRGGLGAGRAGREPPFHPRGALPSPLCPPAHGARLGAAARAGPR